MKKKAIILGSGLSAFDGVEPFESISYKDLNAENKNWPLGKVKGHKGVLDKYKSDDASSEVWVLRGRAHLYEGFSWEEVCYPTQYLVDNGITELTVTNAAGGINPEFEIGDLMQITGFLNFLKPARKRGNTEALLDKPRSINTKTIDGIRQGVYVGVHGPNYETDSEVALFRSMGADAVGMSTIPELETITKANENGSNIELRAVSIITNVYGKTEDLGHEGVVAVAKQSSQKLMQLLGLN